MKALYDLPAPAKLNLFLHITGRRDDGYHLLQSAFMLIDWCDMLQIELRNDGQLSREDLTTPLPADDLVLRAARALQIYAAPGQGAHIGVAKHIPAQAGMGGGSSDAATCLLALQRLWGLDLPLATLEKIGLTLGADVPFFLRGQNAWVEGIGEAITPIPVAPARFVVVKPSEGLDTRRIFAAEDLERATPTAIISGFAADDAAERENFKHSGVRDFEFGHNDLQPVAQRLCPAVSVAIDWLGTQGLAARMTGSGSAVFAVMPRDVELDDPPEDWQVRKCSNMAAHPLVDWVV
ncbi:4-(cytidine 5'-diphospho)-2-C-methyl-D-erythritol kinase [Variovorax sp. PAMC 28711]|uniref:4-(cytidine 5'-diphospho)-2-C-methyl-D-erythritol kinase n=1 Tax=Variovorax sp. PAMC 28711 TaxID=1795631 RepID=UPI00078C4BFA|nr:4-(cytidine 5'-diphospho)-2-C-methyl-D-erythritol kinase [Variovorax sp. PAMC 28711]AMM25383.1 4-diphosphocytidyl-2C-methyl-D-erythritol kinase [Variovorax sp. PAMC 28711]